MERIWRQETVSYLLADRDEAVTSDKRVLEYEINKTRES